MYSKTLFKLAAWRVAEDNGHDKKAFIPPGGGDPMAAAGGMPPMDPAAMAGGGGMPPPMDPAMMDPAAMGGSMPPPSAPPPMPGMDPMAGLGDTIRGIIQQELANAGGMGGRGGATGAKGGPVKADINSVANDIFQVKKILVYLLNMWEIPLPPDILDGPNRDPATGAPVAPGTPGSTSDPSKVQSPPNNSAIKPIEAMQPAMPAPGGPEKQSHDWRYDIGQETTREENQSSGFSEIAGKAANLARLTNSLRKKG